MNTITEKPNKRKFKRDIFTDSGVIIPKNNPNKIPFATVDISEGGLKILTDRKIESTMCEVYLERLKLTAQIVHEETRKSTIMEKQSFYYGLKFSKPIPAAVKASLLKMSKKVF